MLAVGALVGVAASVALDAGLARRRRRRRRSPPTMRIIDIEYNIDKRHNWSHEVYRVTTDTGGEKFTFFVTYAHTGSGYMSVSDVTRDDGGPVTVGQSDQLRAAIASHNTNALFPEPETPDPDGAQQLAAIVGDVVKK